MKVSLLRDENGPTAFRFGSTGTAFPFDAGDEDSVAKAFAKAVNEGIENGAEIEGEAALKVAAVLKAAGDLAWPAGSGYQALVNAVQEQLPKKTNGTGSNTWESCPWYVQDVALDGSCALICGWDSGAEENYVVPLTVHGDGAEATVVLGTRSEWKEVERDFVEKSGRVFSGRNLTAMKEAHDALGKLIELGAPAQTFSEEEEAAKAAASGPPLTYTVEKANSAMRYTLGPLYAPMREDAHKEWIEADELQKSVHEFVRDSADKGRRINLQHGDKGDIQCGEWVECMAWPYEHTIKMTNAAGEEHEVDMPAGTVYLGVVWDEDYWDVEKCAPKGIDGYSLGGRAVKVRGTEESLKDMGYKVRKFSKHDYTPDSDGNCKVCGATEDDGNHNSEAAAKSRDLELAGEIGATAARGKLASDINERLLDILHDNAKTGVTINESGIGLDALVE